jgi:hypothetical protein
LHPSSLVPLINGSPEILVSRRCNVEPQRHRGHREEGSEMGVYELRICGENIWREYVARSRRPEQ